MSPPPVPPQPAKSKLAAITIGEAKNASENLFAIHPLPLHIQLSWQSKPKTTEPMPKFSTEVAEYVERCACSFVSC